MTDASPGPIRRELWIAGLLAYYAPILLALVIANTIRRLHEVIRR